MPAKKTTAVLRGGRGAATAKRKTTKKRGPAAPRGPEPLESAIDLADPSVAPLARQIAKAGGATLAAYRDPYAGTPLLFASLPLRAIEATPFQRDLSKVHADRISDAIGAVGVFLDPVIAVPSDDGGFTSPNGRHRLAAAKKLGLRTVSALVVTDPRIAYRILPLNTEKAHNLRDRSVEVIRMARSLAKEQPRSREKDHAVAFEAAHFLTLGTAYEERGRFAGSSYQSMLRRVDVFLDGTLPAALRQRDQWGRRLLDIDDRVAAHVKTLQGMGFKSPYLRAVVVARCNPVRWLPQKRGAPPPMRMAEALGKMAANVRKFDPKSVRAGDLALVAAVSADE
ncbi:MAG TPA: ParB N-terminal domain-containing protein [Candidatus Limnocylindria bacterium]|jgi:ParB family chromosome partitioning protein